MGGRWMSGVYRRGCGISVGCQDRLSSASPIFSTMRVLEWTSACQYESTCAFVQGLMKTANVIEGPRREVLGPVVVRVLIKMVLNKLVPQDAKFAPK
jgi:hypothetical protein